MHLRYDNGSELVSEVMVKWAIGIVKWAIGERMKKAFIESVRGR